MTPRWDHDTKVRIDTIEDLDKEVGNVMVSEATSDEIMVDFTEGVSQV